jgi:hypothetical protein
MSFAQAERMDDDPPAGDAWMTLLSNGGGSDTFYEQAVVYHDMALRQAVEKTFDEDNLHSTLVCSCTS